jgi:hypothetical protein
VTYNVSLAYGYSKTITLSDGDQRHTVPTVKRLIKTLKIKNGLMLDELMSLNLQTVFCYTLILRIRSIRKLKMYPERDQQYYCANPAASQQVNDVVPAY